MLVVVDVNKKIFILLRSMFAVYYVRLQWISHGEYTVNGHCGCGGTSFYLILCECTATSGSISLRKLFAIICVDQDGVPFMNPSAATLNIWCRTPGLQGFASSGTVHLLRK